jgi:hypothetical protein
VGGSAWLLYYAPKTAYDRAEEAKVGKPAAAEEMAAETLRHHFLKPGADHHSDFIKLLGSGKLALELQEERSRRKIESYVFRLYSVEEGGGLKELGTKLWISKVVPGAAALGSVCVISPQCSGVVYSYYAASKPYVLRRCCVSAAVSG